MCKSYVSDYGGLNFTASLVQSWFVIEYFINVYWFDFLAEKRDAFSSEDKEVWRNKHQRDILKDYTASTISDMLELTGCIEHSIFIKMGKVRNKRNKVVHSAEMVDKLAEKIKDNPKGNKVDTFSVSNDDCIDAFDVICYFVQEVYGVDLRISYGFGVFPF